MTVTPGRYQDTQNRGREGAVTANQLAGSPVGPTHQFAAMQGAAPAANTFSTAPYKPRVRKRGKALLCVAKNNTCEGPRARDTLYCIGHLRQQGLAGDVNDAKSPQEIIVE